MQLVDLIGIQLDPVAGVSVLVLREQDEPNRVLHIVVGGAEAASIAMAAQGVRPPRPMTHDLMATLVGSLDGHLDAVEVTELRDGAFVAALAVSGPAGSHRVDTRASDAIALAVRLHAPLLVSDEVLDEAGVVPEPVEPEQLGVEPLDPEQIDAEVDAFRALLDELVPDDFAPGRTGESGESGEPDVSPPPDGAA